MKLHWSPKSPYVRKVMVCAAELQITDQLVLLRSVAAMLQPNPAIMADNPLSKIPTLLRDGGPPLFDSRVICEYLNAQADGPLFPKDGEARWQALRWQAFADGLLDLLILWRNERERAQPLQPLMAAFEFKAQASLQALDGEVAALQAAPFGIGHVSLCCALGYLDYRFAALDWRRDRAALSTWFQAMQQRPSVASTQPVDG